MLTDYTGTILLVSHDRDFIDRIATSTLMFEGEGKWMEYAGGYTDMLAQRGQGVEARTEKQQPKERATPKPQQERPPVRRMTFKDKHALDTLPAKITDIETELIALEKTLADPALFARNPKLFDTTSRRMAQALAEKTAAEAQWLDLEILREDIEAG